MRIEAVDRLTTEQVDAVRAVLTAATDVDGTPPLSEHVFLHLTQGGDVADVHLLVWSDSTLAGYAHLDATDLVAGPSAELVVHPEHRRQGLGTRLVEELLRRSNGRLRLWAHGLHPAAATLANRLGFERSRVLWQLRRSLLTQLPDPPMPDGVTVRTFVVGQDEEQWLALNNRAFAAHPEQGRWTLLDVEQREAEDWFDPKGFFLAERDGRLVAFHWTKVHGATPGHSHEHDPIGEVYVLGVDPDAAGAGLGAAMTAVGLQHLRDLGLGEVMLYVDDDNPSAVRLYERLGFATWDKDVSFSRDGDESGQTSSL